MIAHIVTTLIVLFFVMFLLNVSKFTIDDKSQSTTLPIAPTVTVVTEKPAASAATEQPKLMSLNQFRRFQNDRLNRDYKENDRPRPRKNLYKDTVDDRFDNEKIYFQDARETIRHNDWRNQLPQKQPSHTRSYRNIANTNRGHDFDDFISSPGHGAVLSDADKYKINAKYANHDTGFPTCPGTYATDGWRYFATASTTGKVFPLCSKPNQLRSEQDRFHSHYDYMIINENRLPIYLNINEFDDSRMRDNQLIDVPGYSDKFKVILNKQDPRMFYQSV